MVKKNNLLPEKLTSKDLTNAWLRWHFVNEIPHAFDRYIAPSLLFALMPILRKLYKNKKKLIEAYKRHLLFFNTQATWGGGTITGITASLEEIRASEELNKKKITITDDLIYNTKAGLMGALAGIGDSIDSGTIQYIFIAIALPWAQEGLAIGSLFPFIFFSLYQFFIGLYFTKMGYRLGRKAATKIVAGKKMQTIIESLSILGLFMMGILAGTYVKIAPNIRFSLSGKDFSIIKIFDSVIPGFFPLAGVMLIYYYFLKKGLAITKALIWSIFMLSLLCGLEELIKLLF